MFKTIGFALLLAIATGLPGLASAARPAAPPAAKASPVDMALRIHFDRHGVVKSVKIALSSGNATTDAAVLASAWKWHSKPASRNGVTVDSWVTVPITLAMQAK